jgi:hypothetical protein
VASAAATMIDAGHPPEQQVAAWTVEKQMRTAEVAKLRAAVADASQRLGAVKRRVAEAQQKVGAGRTERHSLEQWFKRQVGTRTAAVEEARREVRHLQCELARGVIAERGTFGAEFDASREEVARLSRAAEARAHEVAVHETAIGAYDRRGLRTGIVVGTLAALILATLLTVPVVWRATMTVEPPPPLTPITTPAPSK